MIKIRKMDKNKKTNSQNVQKNKLINRMAILKLYKKK